MAFAGVSVIADGKLIEGSTTPTFNAGGASGYHLLVIHGLSRTKNFTKQVSHSHSFTVGGHSWRILYHHLANIRPGHTFFFLCLLGGDNVVDAANPVKVQLEFSFGDETDMQEPARVRANNVAEFGGGNGNESSFGHGWFLPRKASEKSTHPEDDSFTIRCDVVVLNPTCDASPFVEVPPSDMQQNFADLLLAGEGTDVVFRVGGETIPAHRCVLAARSPVFRALLFGPMKEGSATTEIQIDDMDAEVFKALLGFIYGDSLPEAMEEESRYVVLLQHLLVAADRYGLRRLRAMCEGKLCEHIGVSTATTILALAEQHGCHGLKDACYKFLRCPANLRAVVATDGFDLLCRSCPPVMKDLILGMLQAPK